MFRGRPFETAGPSTARARPGAWAAFALWGVVLAQVVFASAGILGATGLRYAAEREIPVELPRAEGARAVRVGAREVIIHVGPTGEVRMAGRAVSVEEAGRRLARLEREAGATSLTIRADARADYGLVAALLGAASSAGVERVALLVVSP
jgi:biopolymer transport protein ExbD